MPTNIFFYPYTSPIILTDELFVQYGGQTGSSSALQRQQAYFLAEYGISQAIDTFLLPTNVTGSFFVDVKLEYFLGHTFVNSINFVTLYSRNMDSSCTLQSTSSCAYLRNAQRGLVDIRLQGACGCSGLLIPYQIEVGYNAGLPSGTVYNSPIMWALALEARRELDELLGQSATPGGVGITEWSNQEYREKRMAMKQTPFGSTTEDQRIMRLLSGFIKYRWVGL